MSPETFAGHVRHYCEWAESSTHDIGTVHPLLLALMEGAPSLKTSSGFPPDRGFPGLPQDVLWAETKRFADFPFQCYTPVLWPYEVHPEGSLTDNIHEDLAHIYAELRHGLQAMEQGDTMCALGYWRDSYFFHWGHHASAAVWAIEQHRLRIQNGEPTAPPNGGPATQPDNSGTAEGPPLAS
jgi:hypothetical protein